MAESAGQAVHGEAERNVAALVAKTVRFYGRSWRKPGVFVEEYGAWRKDIGFWRSEVHGDRDLLREIVNNRVTLALREADQEIVDRSGDPTFGYIVSPCLALAKAEGHSEKMPEYAVCLMWRGPKPMFWPHKVTQKDMDAAKADDDGYDKDYVDLCGMSPTDYLRGARKKRERAGRGKN